MIIRLEQLRKWLRGESKEERIERAPASPEPSPQDAQAAMQAQTYSDPYASFNAAANAYQHHLMAANYNQQLQQAHLAAQQAVYQEAMRYPTFESDAREVIDQTESLAEFNYFYCMRAKSETLVDLMKWMQDNCSAYFAIIPVRRHVGYLACFVSEHDAVAFRLAHDDMVLIER